MKYAVTISAVFIISLLASAAVCYTIGMRKDPELARLGTQQLQNCWSQLKSKTSGMFCSKNAYK